MRHGTAENATRSDFSRQLSDKGIEGVKQSAVRLRERNVQPLKVIASPLSRAQQTAKIMVEELGIEQAILTIDEISPAGDPKTVIESIEEFVCFELCLLVSHQPFVSTFIRYLTGAEAYMDTATVACINAETLALNCGDLEWLIHV